jgi:hypothetical protein
MVEFLLAQFKPKQIAESEMRKFFAAIVCGAVIALLSSVSVAPTNAQDVSCSKMRDKCRTLHHPKLCGVAFASCKKVGHWVDPEGGSGAGQTGAAQQQQMQQQTQKQQMQKPQMQKQ